MILRRLRPPDAPAYRALMLEALETDSDAFTATRAEHGAQPLAWWVARVSEAPEAPEQVFGAFVEDELIGLAGIRFGGRIRTRHKATLFGMYVRPTRRGTGIGKRLVETVLEAARAHPATQLVQLTVVAENDAARHLYESCGFRVFGIEPFANRVGARYVAHAHLWCPVDPALQDP